MSTNPRATQMKRQRERNRQEDKQEKAEKRVLRKERRRERDEAVRTGNVPSIDPDLAGIVPGPQPLPQY